MKALLIIASIFSASTVFAAPTESLSGWVRENASCPSKYEIYVVDENEKPSLVTCVIWADAISTVTKNQVIADSTSYTLYGEQSDEGFIVVSVSKDQ